MKWYRSLQSKSILFFSGTALLFIAIIFLNFSYMKQSRLESEARDLVALTTDPVVTELLIKQQRAEQLVLDMALIGGRFPSAEPVKDLLENSWLREVVSGGVWFEPEIVGKEGVKAAYFFHRDPRGAYRIVENYTELTPIPYRRMEFYVLGRHRKKGAVFWTKVYTDPVTRVRMITVVAPIYRGERFVGVASVDMKLELGKNEIFAPLLKSNGYFAILDRVGNFIVSSENLHRKAPRIEAEILKLSSALKDGSENNMTLARLMSRESPEISLKDATIISREFFYDDLSRTGRVVHDLMFLKEDPILKDRSVVAIFYFPKLGWRMVIGIPEEILFHDLNAIYRTLTLSMVLFALLFVLMGYLFVRRVMLNPLQEITSQIENRKRHEGERIQTKDRGEIGLLVERFNEREAALRDAREKERKSEQLLMQQSKMAAMGEMLDAVAHQWKQPLNALSMYNDLLAGDFRDGNVDESYIENFRKDIHTQIDHMLTTLDTFRSFFRPGTKVERFSMNEVVGDVLLLAKDDLLKHGINVSVEGEDFRISGSRNEMRHLLLNLFSNAKDAFVEREIFPRNLSIRIFGNDARPRLEFCDNAGGIPEEIVDEIFKAHVTTKEEGKGTGIGLYMSRQIVEKHHGSLRVENRGEGACFIVEFIVRDDESDGEEDRGG